ncbi:MAG: alpha-glucan family phosphorylase [Bacteroidota bacterium]|nr:alpha-glucan family phosphorylase [Bacteroidota bacterium]
MKESPYSLPDYLFEVSWEVCNKVGGIHTVVSTKALTLVNKLKDNYILIGPDIYKETHQNPEFLEDKFLFKSWRKKAESEGLKIRAGRWNIAGRPAVILVDFTTYFTEKDKIFAWMWENYQLDSLSGAWDYIEPALFGYAASRVIESFYDYQISFLDRLVAQFHEWMTGMGVLYLKKKVPQIATVFTTHATVMGRCIAGNGLPLYKNLSNYNGDTMARNYGVVSKLSLEKISAREADTFTTVSEITNHECGQFLGKNVDVITPNGFENTFVPGKNRFFEKRALARNKMIDVAEGILNTHLPQNSIFLITSGRYEFRNKGIGLYIDALGKLNKQSKLSVPIIAFLAIPAYQLGPRKDLLTRMAEKNFTKPITDEFLTHGLHEPENDMILKRIQKNNLHNRPQDHVKVIFVPAYLNGDDGVFNIPYYDLLIGFDGTIFPSYYEPWGYTPLESLAFHIPTITTSLAGFGLWVKKLYPEVNDSITVIPRGDDNDAFVVDEIVKSFLTISNKPDKEIIRIRLRASEISRSALWENLIIYYLEAYSKAIDKVNARADLFKEKQPKILAEPIRVTVVSKPEWKKLFVQQELPENLKDLLRLSNNLWWTWNQEGSELFEMIDRHRWVEMDYNPISLIESLSLKELQALSNNVPFLAKLAKVTADFNAYMEMPVNDPKHLVAYFSMEYGLHDTVQIFSGGLGILAGDYLKEASDSGFNIIGIGLLYRYGYFQQQLSITGEQIEVYTPQKFTHLPLIPVRDKDGNWIRVPFVLRGRTIYAKVWRVDVGRVPLYLMDTDISENIESDREITHKLYGGDSENRLRQEIILGVGGIRMLEALDIHPDIYHSNEGHSAFNGIERLKHLITIDKLTFNQAVEVVRSSTLFTTHTPVPAGHDTFSEDLLRQYFGHFPDHLNIKWEELLQLGKMTHDPEEKFSMSILAAKLSQEINGVSRIHGRVTREMFAPLYPGYYPSELNIGYITNGVHYPTWAAKSWQNLYENSFGEGFHDDQSNPAYWRKIHEVDDKIIWKERLKQKRQLTRYLINRVYEEMTRRNENPKMIFKLRETVGKDAMTFGFARRVATYKRAYLLFSNLDRLSKIVNNPLRPVRFIFAGKAHPNDQEGQDLIKKIYEISKTPDFLGKIFFVENYDMELAKFMVRGVDVWLNTPTRPLEASGTSGEKAVMNGVVNFSVLDGWWAEGYRKEAGWALRQEVTYKNSQFQDELDAETIYTLLEEEIIPVYFEMDDNKLPVRWISYIKNTISEIAPHFTMKRQLDEYISKYYIPLFERSQALKAHNYETARYLASWKRNVIRSWDDIRVISLNVPDSSLKPLRLGESFKAEIVLDLDGLSGEDVGIEVIFGKKINDRVTNPVIIQELKRVSVNKNVVTFVCEIPFDQAGVYDFSFRLFPKNPLLPHRQDFSLVKWI